MFGIHSVKTQNLITIFQRNVVLRLRIDDPNEAISIHALGGVLSLFLAPILSEKYGMIYLMASKPSLLYFAWNLTTIVALISWSVVTSLMIFGPLAYFDKLGKILDSKEGNLEVREVITEKETPKKKKIKVCAFWASF